LRPTTRDASFYESAFSEKVHRSGCMDNKPMARITANHQEFIEAGPKICFSGDKAAADIVGGLPAEPVPGPTTAN
jgi:hypothetical protein